MSSRSFGDPLKYRDQSLTAQVVTRPIARMSDDRKVTRGRSVAERRREREAEALRANLRKRKDQQRAREASTEEKARDADTGPIEPDGDDVATG